MSNLTVVVLALASLSMSVTLSARPLVPLALPYPWPFEASAPSPIQPPPFSLTRLGQLLGYSAIVVGLTPSIPQLCEMIQRKKGDAISMDMMALRLVADVVGLSGSILSREPLYNIILSCLYITDTSIFTSVSIYYTYYCKNCDHSLPTSDAAHPLLSRMACACRNSWASVISLPSAISKLLTALPEKVQAVSRQVSVLTWTVCAIIIFTPIISAMFARTFLADSLPVYELRNMIGRFCLWSSNLLFVTCRVPQIHKIMKEHSLEGLSKLMYQCLVTSRLLSGTSILLPDIESHAPVLDTLLGSDGAIFLGMYGCATLDSFVLYLFSKYGTLEGSSYAVPEDDDDKGSYVLIEELPEDPVEIPAKINHSVLVDDCNNESVALEELPIDGEEIHEYHDVSDDDPMGEYVLIEELPEDAAQILMSHDIDVYVDASSELPSSEM